MLGAKKWILMRMMKILLVSKCKEDAKKDNSAGKKH